MQLREQIAKDFNEALKSRDERKLSALRLLRTEIKKREVSGQKKELSEVEIIETVSSLIKQRRESIRLFQEGNRLDLVAKEEAELKILLSYLPQPLSRTEIEALVEQIISETGAKNLKDLGLVMKKIMPKVSGRADGKLVNEIVKEKLSPKAT